MPTPYASTIVPAGIEEVWELLSDFGGLAKWHPGLAECELEDGGQAVAIGSVRALRLADGGSLRERLVAVDEPARKVSYDILESPFPVRKYRACIRAAPVTTSGQTFVEWWCEYDAEADKEEKLNKTFAEGVFAGGLTGLVDYFASGSRPGND